MKIDLEIKALAKQIYLTPDENDPRHRKYSIRQIPDVIRQQHDKAPHHSTVSEWVKEGQWESDWDEYLIAGAWKTVNPKSDVEKHTQDVRSDKLALYYENNDLHLEMTDDIITRKLKTYDKDTTLLNPSDFATVQRINVAAKVLAKEKELDIEKLAMRDTVLEINYNVVHLDTEPPLQIEPKDDE